MTPEQLWKLAFRTCEAKLRKSGPVFSEAEIMEEFPQLVQGHIITESGYINNGVKTVAERTVDGVSDKATLDGKVLYGNRLSLSRINSIMGGPITEVIKIGSGETEDLEEQLTAAFERKIEASKE